MTTDATEADWQRIGVGLQSLWQAPKAAGRISGRPFDGDLGDRAAAQAIQDAVVLEIWEDDGGAAVRRSAAPPGGARAHRRGLPVGDGVPCDLAPGLPAPARPLNT